MHTQSPKPSPPFNSNPYEGFVYINFEDGRLVMEENVTLPDFTVRGRVLVNEHGAIQQNLNANQNFPARRPAHALRDFIYRRLPHALLIEAKKHSGSILWIGRESYNGKPVDLVDAQNRSGEVVRLAFDQQTGRLLTATQIISDPLLGDVQDQSQYEAYRQQSGIWMPSSYRRLMNGQTTVSVEFASVTLGPAADLAELPFPAEAPKQDGQTGAEQPKIAFKELAEGVHLATGIGGAGYNSMIVQLTNGLLVAEAPLSSEASEALLEQISGKWPNEPIRYVVATHHHEDHSGGIRALVAAGATLITTKGNEEFFRKVVQAPRSLIPDLLARQPRDLKFQFVENSKLTIPDAGRKIEILQLSAAPHAEEMLVVWLPESRLLFQGDLFTYFSENPQPGRAQAQGLVRLIEQRDLQVESIAGVHGEVASMAAFRAAMAKFQEQQRS